MTDEIIGHTEGALRAHFAREAIAQLEAENVKLRDCLCRLQDAILDHVEDKRDPSPTTLLYWRDDALNALGRQR